MQVCDAMEIHNSSIVGSDVVHYLTVSVGSAPLHNILRFTTLGHIKLI